MIDTAYVPVKYCSGCEFRTDPLTARPAISPGEWRQRILDAYRAT